MLYLQAFGSNMDLSFVTNAYAAIVYMCSYVAKPEREVGEAMRDALKALPKDWSTRKKQYHLANAFFNSRHMSLQETAHLILGLPLVMKSRKVVFIATGLPSKRHRLRKPLAELQKLEPGSEDVFVKSIIEKYAARNIGSGTEVQHLCLAQFASRYENFLSNMILISDEVLLTIQTKIYHGL